MRVYIHTHTYIYRSCRGLERFFSRKWPGNTSCNAFVHFSAWIRAQGMLLHFLRVPLSSLSSPPGTLGLRGSKKVIVMFAWEAALDSRGPNTKLLFSYHCVFSFSWLPPLSFLRGDFIWMHTGHIQVEAESQSLGYFWPDNINLWWKFLYRIVAEPSHPST